jgi:predicted ATPase
MRIAVSGTHFSGKSTLIEDLSDLLPRYVTVDEPYRLLEEEGHEFPAIPSLEDFESQLTRSLEALDDDQDDVLFDRCPLDLLGYILTLSDAESFELDDWMPEIREAIESLDLIVFLPVEADDRIAAPATEDEDFRQQVDEKLKEIIRDNPYDFDVEILEVTGTRKQRVARVMDRVKGAKSP